MVCRLWDCAQGIDGGCHGAVVRHDNDIHFLCGCVRCRPVEIARHRRDNLFVFYFLKKQNKTNDSKSIKASVCTCKFCWNRLGDPKSIIEAAEWTTFEGGPKYPAEGRQVVRRQA